MVSPVLNFLMQDSKNNFAVLNDLYAEGFLIMINFIVKMNQSVGING